MEPSHKELQRRIGDIVSMIHSFLDKMDTFVPKKSGDMYVKQAMGRELHCHLEMIEMQLTRASSALNVGYSIGGRERYHLLESSFYQIPNMRCQAKDTAGCLTLDSGHHKRNGSGASMKLQ